MIRQMVVEHDTHDVLILCANLEKNVTLLRDKKTMAVRWSVTAISRGSARAIQEGVLEGQDMLHGTLDNLAIFVACSQRALIDSQ